MALRKVEPSDWHGYCNAISKLLIGKRAEIEIAARSLGDQIEAEWLPLVGIAYDHKANLIEIALADVGHLIHDPKEFYVQEGALGVEAILVIDGTDKRQIIRLRDAVALPWLSAADRPS